MKMKLFALVCGLTASASLFADTVQVTLAGVNGQSDGSYYISPYYGVVAGNNQDIYCDDFNNDINIGQTFTANVTNLATGAFNPGTTRYGTTTDILATDNSGDTQSYDGQQLYEMSAYLTTQFDTADNSDPNNIQIQYTIWDLFSPTAPQANDNNAYLFAAEASLGSLDYSQFNILTDVNAMGGTGGVQEFLTGPVTGTPEPSSMLMLGCGLMLVSTIAYRRRKANQNL